VHAQQLVARLLEMVELRRFPFFRHVALAAVVAP
jgi:hypothetical protein